MAAATNTFALNYAYPGVVRGIKNALGSSAIIRALTVLNNTYLMESDTDYGKLFNSILILHHLPSGEVTEESLMALKIHQVYLS